MQTDTITNLVTIGHVSFHDIRDGAQYSRGWWTISLATAEEPALATFADREDRERAGRVFVGHGVDMQWLRDSVGREIGMNVGLVRDEEEGGYAVRTPAWPTILVCSCGRVTLHTITPTRSCRGRCGYIAIACPDCQRRGRTTRKRLNSHHARCLSARPAAW